MHTSEKSSIFASEKVEEIAKRIRMKMNELDIETNPDFDDGEIGVDNMVVRVVNVKANSGFAYEFLGIKRFEGEYNRKAWASLEDIGKTYYFCNDFNAKVYGATNKQALWFLNLAAKLIKGFGEIEQNNVEEIKRALENAPTI